MNGVPGDDGAAADLWRRLLAALERPCRVCGGTGEVLSDAWKVWHERAGELIRVAQAARRATALHPPAAERDAAVARGGAGPGAGGAGGGQAYGGGSGGAGVPGQVPQALRETTPQGVPQMAPVAAPAGGAEPPPVVAPPGAGPGPAGYGSVGGGPLEAGFPSGDSLPGDPMGGGFAAGGPSAPSGGGGAGEPGSGGAAPAIVAAIDRAIAEHMRARPPGPERVPCEACQGCGRALTAAGMGLTEFLARHGLVWADPGMNGRAGEPVQRGDGPFPTPPRGQL